MKKMIYNTTGKTKILAEGSVNNVSFCILNCRCAHPCAYIKLPKQLESEFKDYDDLNKYVNVHGGFTYGGNDYWHEEKDQEGVWFGWDYAHYGDFVGYYLEDKDRIKDETLHKWTTEEVYKDVQDVIKQLKKYIAQTKVINNLNYEDENVPLELNYSGLNVNFKEVIINGVRFKREN